MKKISLVSFFVIFIDRFVKIMVQKTLKLNIRNKVINNFFYLTYCQNKGAAFSIFNGKVFFLILLTIIFLYFIYYFIKNETKITKFVIIEYGLLIGGILGNFIDRVVYGYVIDYLDFKIFNYDFAIFNLADTFIVIGVILLIFSKGSDKDGEKNVNR